MKQTIDIIIDTDDNHIPDRSDFEKWVSLTLKDHSQTEICIKIVDENEIQTLNNNFRSKNKPTNVLSFPNDDEQDEYLGDIAICASIVAKEAEEKNIPVNSHWAHLVIHATLHLLGHDHMTDEEATAMESIEIKLLQELNISNPYEANE